jgi:hypothetical protein
MDARSPLSQRRRVARPGLVCGLRNGLRGSVRLCCRCRGSAPASARSAMPRAPSAPGAVQVIDVDARVATAPERRSAPCQVRVAIAGASARFKPDRAGRCDRGRHLGSASGNTVRRRSHRPAHACPWSMPPRCRSRPSIATASSACPSPVASWAGARTPRQVEEENRQASREKGPINRRAMVRVVHNNSSTVTIVGEVANNLRMPLSARGERLLDCIGCRRGARQAINKTTIRDHSRQQSCIDADGAGHPRSGRERRAPIGRT